MTERFNVGDMVALKSNPDAIFPIIEVLSGQAETRYRVFQNNGKVLYYHRQLSAARSLVAEPAPVTLQEVQARLTSLHLLSPSTAHLFSLRAGRVHFVPYQYRPVLKLIRSDRPRLLIADEVGVGKTIEAALILKELRARMNLASVLVVCPKALVAEGKWATEMKRFDEPFMALDGKLLRHCLEETDLNGTWPDQYARAILPFSLFDAELLDGSARGKRKRPGLLKLDPPPKFDLIIVDEAHHLRNSDTLLHRGVKHLCEHAQAVIFLSATPVQLGSRDLFTLLNLLRPDLVIDPVSFAQMAEPNHHLHDAIFHCRSGKNKWQQAALSALVAACATEWGRLFIGTAPDFGRMVERLMMGRLDDSDRVQLIQKLEDFNTFSRLISRTRRRDIGEFTTRKPETRTIPFTTEQKVLHDGVLDVIRRILMRFHGQQSVSFMMTTLRRQAASCLYGLVPLLSDMLHKKLDLLEWMEASDCELEPDQGFLSEIREEIESLLQLARSLSPEDPKADAFTQVLLDKGHLPNNKALVFSTFRHTLAYLEARLQTEGMRVGLIHGGVPDETRTELRRRFSLSAADPDALDVLLSSEVGCEGLDFQFCDLLVNYDLPWNPMRIEQRIGRLDRYGQKSEVVAIVNLITPDTVDAEIYHRCLWRIGVFQRALGGSEEVLGNITQELHNIAESFALSPDERVARLQQLADNGIRKIQEEQTLETKQAELFGLKVPRQSWMKEIEAAESTWLAPDALQKAVATYLERRIGPGKEYLLGEKPVKTLRLNQDARALLLEDYRKLPHSTDTASRKWEQWLQGGQPTLTVTFSQESATEHPDSTISRCCIRWCARLHDSLRSRNPATSPAPLPMRCFLPDYTPLRSTDGARMASLPTRS